MSPTAAIIGTVIRWALTTVIAFAVGHKWLTQEQAGQINIASIVAWAVPILVPLVWSIYVRLHSKAKLAVALSQPAGTPESSVNDIVAKQGITASIKSAPLILALLLPCSLFLTSCAGGMNAVRSNVESVDFKGSYGGAAVRAGVHLREPDRSKDL